MKRIEQKIEIDVLSPDELTATDRALVEAAKSATRRSYAPYSQFRVGAALRLADGTIVTGNNQENVAYPSGLCAERVALFYANAQHPEIAIDTIAIAAHNGGGYTAQPITPCGGCRQVMLESEQRQQRPIRLLLYGTHQTYVVEGIAQLIPLAFTL